MEILFELLGEFLLQAVGEILVEIGLHSLAAPFKREPNPWLVAIGYLLFGCIAGSLSLLVFSHHMTPAGWPRVANLFLTPVLAGILMSLVGRWRANRGDRVLRIDRFAHGYLFAVGLAAVRFQLAG